MRILQVCPYDLQRPGGVQSHVRELSQELRARGHEVCLLGPNASGEDLPPVHNHTLAFHGTQVDFNLAPWRRLYRWLKARRFDLIHFHTLWNPVLGWQVRLSTRLPAVGTFHDCPPPTLLGRLLRHGVMPLAAWCLRRWCLDRTVAVSPVTAGYLGSPERIPNGIRTSQFWAAPFPELRDGRVNLLYLGRLEPRKGVLDLLEAYAALCRERSDLRLIVAGDGPLRGRVERLARGLSHVVLAGEVPEADKSRWYASADLFCAPSRYGESFGIVLLEAMASRLPLVAADNEGYRLLVPASLRYPPGDPLALRDRLRRLLEDPGLRQHWGNWGLGQARKYEWGHVVDRIERVYREVLQTRKR